MAKRKRPSSEDEDGTGKVIGELRQKLEEAAPPEKVLAEAQRDLTPDDI